MKALTINSIAVYLAATGGDVTINLKQGSTVVKTKTVTGLAGGKQTINLGFVVSPGSYIIDAAGSSANTILFENANSATFPYTYPDYISFTNNVGWQSSWYGLFYDWKITAGNVCSRTPVAAVIDPNNPNCSLKTVDTTVTACTSFKYHGKTYTKSGDYALGISPKDTILHLTVNVPTQSSLTVSSVGSYVLLGKMYTKSGDYVQTATNKAGCDSIISLNLTITTPPGTVITQSACTSYLFNDTLRTKSGTYIQKLKSKLGTDSIVSLILTIKSVTTSNIIVSAVGNYTLLGTNYIKTGVYTKTTTNNAGCDSIITLNLTILDFTNLTTAINTANGYVTTGNPELHYPAAAIVTLQSAITKAQTVANSTTVKQSEIENATTALNNAITTFLNSAIDPIDKSLLLAQISVATTDVKGAIVGTNPGNYPQSAVDALNTAIKLATDVADNNLATKVEVGKATDDLKVAIETFLKTAVTVDKSALIISLNSANSTLTNVKDKIGSSVGQYSKVAADSLQTAINNANKLLASQSVTQAQIDASKIALEDAVSKFNSSIISGFEDVQSPVVKIWPVPAKKVLYVDAETIINHVEIIDIYGKKVYLSTVNGKEISIDLTEIESGYYFITVLFADNTKITKSIDIVK